MSVSIATQAMGYINHVWLTILSGGHGTRDVGLKYVSQGWDDNPFWHLWFHESPGVYRLEMRQSYSETSFDWIADFLVKYFPLQIEPVFDGLSFVEKLFRNSEAFDAFPSAGHGGCPCSGMIHDHVGSRFEELMSGGCGVPYKSMMGGIPPDFFFAGHLSIAYKSDAGVIITAKSQTHWTVEIVKDAPVIGNDGSMQTLLKAGSVDRNYPGLYITSFLYERVITAWQIHLQTDRRTEDRWEGDGVVFRSDGSWLESVASPQIKKVILQTALSFGSNVELVPPMDTDKDGMFRADVKGA